MLTDCAQFAIEAKQDDKLSFTVTERAKIDAKRIEVGQVSPNEDEDLLAVSNHNFDWIYGKAWR